MPDTAKYRQRKLFDAFRWTALSIYGDEPGILVQPSRIDVQLRGDRTFIRDAPRAEVAP